jgi:hypothetical protein
MLPRGIRNNNPGNLRDHGIPWLGLLGRDSEGFCKFKSMFFGCRASMRDMHTDWSRGQTTLKTLIGGLYDSKGTLVRGGWAPPHENNTNEYIEFCCEALEVDEGAALDLSDVTQLARLARAIYRMECGQASLTIPDETIESAARAALEDRK